MPFAAALSEHPVTAFATGEVCGQVLEQLGGHPDVAFVFVTLAHAGALEDVAATVGEILHPSVLVGAAAESVVGIGREVEGGSGISLWAGRFGPVLPVRLTALPDPGGIRVAGLPSQPPFTPTALVLVGDPFSFPAEDVLTDIEAAYPGLPVIGGMASGARGAGGTRLALGDAIHVDGAVGALLGPGAELMTVVSQGCRPIGRPLVVTDGAGSIVRELGGKPPLVRLDELAPTLTSDEIAAINAGGLHLGRVLDERKVEFGPGDFLVRQVLGGDRSTGAIAVNDVVEVGRTVQFHIRDAAAAHSDLDEMLSGTTGGIDAALLFTCNGRGRHLFGVADHDAELLATRTGAVPVTGFFAAGELGPIAGRNHIHSFTASVALLRDSTPAEAG